MPLRVSLVTLQIAAHSICASLAQREYRSTAAVIVATKQFFPYPVYHTLRSLNAAANQAKHVGYLKLFPPVWRRSRSRGRPSLATRLYSSSAGEPKVPSYARCYDWYGALQSWINDFLRKLYSDLAVAFGGLVGLDLSAFV